MQEQRRTAAAHETTELQRELPTGGWAAGHRERQGGALALRVRVQQDGNAHLRKEYLQWCLRSVGMPHAQDRRFGPSQCGMGCILCRHDICDTTCGVCATAPTTGHGLAALLAGLEAVRLRMELLRAHRDANTAELQVCGHG